MPPATPVIPGQQAESILSDMDISFTPALEKEMSPLYDRISSVVPEIEWPFFAPYVKAINELKREKMRSSSRIIIRRLKFFTALQML